MGFCGLPTARRRFVGGPRAVRGGLERKKNILTMFFFWADSRCACEAWTPSNHPPWMAARAQPEGEGAARGDLPRREPNSSGQPSHTQEKSDVKKPSPGWLGADQKRTGRDRDNRKTLSRPVHFFVRTRVGPPVGRKRPAGGRFWIREASGPTFDFFKGGARRRTVRRLATAVWRYVGVLYQYGSNARWWGASAHTYVIDTGREAPHHPRCGPSGTGATSNVSIGMHCEQRLHRDALRVDGGCRGRCE